jgi:hypothetical protein
MAEYTFQCEGKADFLPGQYAMLRLRGVSGDRAYSMSNQLSPDGLWRFIVKRVPGGQETTVLAEALEIGESIELDGPYGRRTWAPKDERLIGRAPHGHWRTMIFIAALRHDRIDAPFVLDGPVNGEAFRAYVKQMLVPTLSPGDVVVTDNLVSHQGQAVRDAIRSVKAHLLFLPPYSPDLNPIE